MRVKISITAVSFFLTATFALVPLVQGADNRLYRIATTAWMGWSPLHVAQEYGFWSRYGVAVEVVNYDNPIIIQEAIKAGRIDFAMEMVGSLVDIFMNDTSVVALAETNWSHGGDKILLQKGHTLQQHLADNVGVFLKQPSSLYFFGLYLKRHNLRLEQFRIVEIDADNLAAQFIAGRIPVMVNYEPWASRALRKTNSELLATSADFPGCIPECIWGYRSHLKRIPDSDIKNIIRGWIDAATWVNTLANWPAYKKILNRQTFAGHAPFSDADLAEMFDNVKIHQPKELLERNRTGGGLHIYLQKLKIFLKSNNLLKKNYTINDIFDNHFIMQVLSDLPN